MAGTLTTEGDSSLHDLLRSGHLPAAVSRVLQTRREDLQKYREILDVFLETGPQEDAYVARHLAAFLLSTGDEAGAHLAFLLSVSASRRSRPVTVCRLLDTPDQCFEMEPLPDETTSRLFLEPSILEWSEPTLAAAALARIPPFVARIDRGSVLGLSFLPATADWRSCLNFLVHNPANTKKIVGYEGADTLPIIANGRLLTCFDGADEYDQGVLIGNFDNFGHWLWNHLARLALVASLPGLGGVPLVVGENITANQLESLVLMGYGESSLIRLRKGRLARFNRLWAPMMPFCAYNSWVYLAPGVVAFLRQKLGIGESPAPAARRRRLYLTRQSARWRRVLNERAVLDFLAGWGFECIDPATLSIRQQIEVAAGAEVVMGAFGAGMNLLLFAPGDAAIIELKTQAGVMDMNPVLTRQTGQRYLAVQATPISAPNIAALDYDMTVTPEQLQEALEAAGLRR